MNGGGRLHPTTAKVIIEGEGGGKLGTDNVNTGGFGAIAKFNGEFSCWFVWEKGIELEKEKEKKGYYFTREKTFRRMSLN